MIPILYKETEKEFRSNGIGQLDETIISETTEVLNGEFELYLEYPSTGQWFNEIKEFRYIQVIPNNQDEEHAFRIYEIDKTDDPESVKVYATTKSNELGDNLIEGFEYKKASPTMLYSQIKKNMLLPSNYNFVTDLTTLGNIDWKFRSPLNCILGEEGSMIQIFGGEIKRTNDYIYHYKRRGKDRVTSVRQEKNLDGFTQTVSTKGLVTKILPYYTYYPTPPEGFKGPVEPETMVIPIVTSAKAKDYPKEVLKAVDFSSYSDEIGATKTITKTEKLKNGKDKVTKTEVFDEKKTRENLIAKADTYFTSMYKGVDEPKVTIDVDLYSLADSAEYDDLASLEHIGISDTVDVWVPKYDIDVTVKVKRLVFDNLTEKVISLSAGSSSTSTYQSQKGDYTQITDDIQDYIDSALDNTVHMAANGSNRIWTGATRPTEGVREGDTWFEPLQDGHTAIHHFDGVEWVFVMDTTDTSDNANRIEEAMKELEKAVEFAAKAYQRADDMAADIVADMDEYIDFELDERGLGADLGERVAEINRIAQESLNKSEINGQIVGNDGRTLYNRNRLLGDTTRTVTYEEGVIQLRHNGEGFMDNAPYVLSMKVAERTFPHLDHTSDVYVASALDTITEYITIFPQPQFDYISEIQVASSLDTITEYIKIGSVI